MGCCPCGGRQTPDFTLCKNLNEVIAMMEIENRSLVEDLENFKDPNDMSKLNYLQLFINHANRYVDDLRIRSVNQKQLEELKILLKQFYSLSLRNSKDDLGNVQNQINTLIANLDAKN
jgi:hypothetical protein